MGTILLIIAAIMALASGVSVLVTYLTIRAWLAHNTINGYILRKTKRQRYRPHTNLYRR